ncbi:MAG: hypothetical protein ACI9N1_002110 [Flavobacteriales bacterium]|jgi:hypothetical protein
MIKAHFDSMVSQLRSNSASLTKENIFVDKPWTIIDEDNEMQRLVFKRNKSLIMSKSGEVNYGSWDYLPEMRSIVINRIKNSILCNEAYIDEGVMILQLDGTSNQFFILANANVIPDLDINKYLSKKSNEILNIESRTLVDGKLLEIHQGRSLHSIIGSSVSIEMEEVADGVYEIAGENKFYEITGSRIIQITTAIIYQNPEEIAITIYQRSNYEITIGDLVFINNMIAEDQTINLSKLERIIINDGKVLTLQHKNVMFGTYHDSHLFNVFITIAAVVTTFIILLKVLF